MSVEQWVRITQRVAEGIHEAHRLGLVHGDLKPGNVLVVEEADGAWHPYVLDFGIARELAAPGATVTTVIAGTPAYMAPEQVRGEAPDRRTDVYALGVTLYRLPQAANAGERFGFADLVIAALVAENAGAIWSLDSDFQRMARIGLVALSEPAG